MGIYPNELKSGSPRGISTPVFIMTSFTIVKMWKWPKCPSIGEQIKKCDRGIRCNTIQTLKRKKFCKMGQHGWTWRTLRSVNKPVTERHGSTYMRYLKLKGHIHRIRVQCWLPGTGKRGQLGITDRQAWSFSQETWTSSKYLLYDTVPIVSSRGLQPDDVTYMIHDTYRHQWLYLRNRDRLTDIENRLEVAKEKRGGGGVN